MANTGTPRVPAQATTSWRVTSQQETSWIDASGQVKQGWQVFYKVGDRTVGSVKIPADEYSRANVAAAVAEAAAEVTAVGNLSG